MSSLVLSPAGDAARLRSGLLSMLAAGFLFACGNAAAKALSDDYPVGEITFFRYLFSILPMACLMVVQGGFRVLGTERPLLHLLRAALGVASSALFYLSLRSQALATAVTLSYTAPLFLTALAVPLLRERVGIYRWSAVVVGFLGVLVAVGFGGHLSFVGVVSGLASAALYALSLVVTRRLAERDNPITIALWFMIGASAFAGLSLPFGFAVPALPHWPLFALMGVGAGTAVFLVTRAYRDAPASVLTVLDYVALLWATLFDALLWAHRPGLSMAVGGTIIVASGAFIVYREIRRKTRVVRARFVA